MKCKVSRIGSVVIFALFALGVVQGNPFGDSPQPVQDYSKFAAPGQSPNYGMFAGQAPIPFWFNELEDVARQHFHCKIIVNNGFSRSMGSGTYIYDDGENGAVLTCYHLFDQAKGDITLVFPGIGEFKAEYFDGVPSQDIVILKTESLPITPAKISYELPRGDHIFCGFPGGGDFAFKTGQYTGKTDRDVGGRISHSLDNGVVPGYSGGGIFNDKGEITGVLWGSNYKKVRIGKAGGNGTKNIPGSHTYFISLYDQAPFVQENLRKIENLSAGNDYDKIAAGEITSLVMVSLKGCAPCEQMKPVIDELAREGYNARWVMNTDYAGPESPTAFPSIYIYKGKQLIFKHEGAIDKQTLISYLNTE